ncbi:hypothetical protein NA63_1810 [Flavobacteriaceae bacterium MAR_2010_105]|nr:hypothetical protein NA63_1810 [Flavobacteriaceae bacterium MAR_2010_105]
MVIKAFLNVSPKLKLFHASVENQTKGLIPQFSTFLNIIFENPTQFPNLQVF